MNKNHLKALIATLLLIAGLNKAAAAIDPVAHRAQPTGQSAAAIPCTLPCLMPDQS